MTKILLVDDEERMLDLLALYLEPKGYKCVKITSGEKAIEHIKKYQYDLVLLDVMMPEIDGWEACNKIRQFSEVPIIMVTAREEKEDIVKGLKIGADDYITKPFDEDELIARIEALLRRTPKKTYIEISGLIWDESTHEVKFRDKVIPLTPKEFAIIGYFIQNPNRVFEREQLIELIWGLNSETEGRTIDSHIRNMRDKIKKSGFSIDNHLKTIWGVGYKWVN